MEEGEGQEEEGTFLQQHPFPSYIKEEPEDYYDNEQEGDEEDGEGFSGLLYPEVEMGGGVDYEEEDALEENEESRRRTLRKRVRKAEIKHELDFEDGEEYNSPDAEPEDEEARLERKAHQQQNYRNRLSEEQKAARRERNRILRREKRADEVTREEERERNRIRARERRANAAKREQERERNRIRAREKRADEANREEERERNRIRQRERRANANEEKKEEVRDRNRACKKESRADDAKKEEERERNRLRQREKRREDNARKAEEREKNRVRTREKRANMTPDEMEKFREKQREYKRKARAKQREMMLSGVGGAIQEGQGQEGDNQVASKVFQNPVSSSSKSTAKPTDSTPTKSKSASPSKSLTKENLAGAKDCLGTKLLRRVDQCITPFVEKQLRQKTINYGKKKASGRNLQEDEEFRFLQHFLYQIKMEVEPCRNKFGEEFLELELGPSVPSPNIPDWLKKHGEWIGSDQEGSGNGSGLFASSLLEIVRSTSGSDESGLNATASGEVDIHNWISRMINTDANSRNFNGDEDESESEDQDLQDWIAQSITQPDEGNNQQSSSGPNNDVPLAPAKNPEESEETSKTINTTRTPKEKERMLRQLRQLRLETYRKEYLKAREKWSQEAPENVIILSKFDDDRKLWREQIDAERPDLIKKFAQTLIARRTLLSKESEEERMLRLKKELEAESSKRFEGICFPTQIGIHQTPSCLLQLTTYPKDPQAKKEVRAATARVRTKMQRYEYELYVNLLKSVGLPAPIVGKDEQKNTVARPAPLNEAALLPPLPEDFENVLRDKGNQGIIDFWHSYRTPRVKIEVTYYRQLLSSFLETRRRLLPQAQEGTPTSSKANTPLLVYETLRVPEPQSLQDIQRFKEFVMKHGDEILSHLSFKRWYIQNKLMERVRNFGPEQKKEYWEGVNERKKKMRSLKREEKQKNMPPKDPSTNRRKRKRTKKDQDQHPLDLDGIKKPKRGRKSMNNLLPPNNTQFPPVPSTSSSSCIVANPAYENYFNNDFWTPNNPAIQEMLAATGNPQMTHGNYGNHIEGGGFYQGHGQTTSGQGQYYSYENNNSNDNQALNYSMQFLPRLGLVGSPQRNWAPHSQSYSHSATPDSCQSSSLLVAPPQFSFGNEDEWEEVPPPQPSSSYQASPPDKKRSRGRPKGSTNNQNPNNNKLQFTMQSQSLPVPRGKKKSGKKRRRDDGRDLWGTRRRRIPHELRVQKEVDKRRKENPEEIVNPFLRNPEEHLLRIRESTMANDVEKIIHKCPQCDKVLWNQGSLERHMKKVHNGGGEQESDEEESSSSQVELACKICSIKLSPQGQGQSKNPEGTLLRHILFVHYEINQYKCPLRKDCTKLRGRCSRWKFNIRGLKVHLRAKHPEDHLESFVYGLSDKQLVGKSAKFFCLHCADTFPSYADVEKHYEDVHLPSRYSCQYCGLYLQMADHWVDHNQLFHGEHNPGTSAPPPVSIDQGKMFLCNSCGCRFSSSSFLDKHKEVDHTLWRYPKQREGSDSEESNESTATPTTVEDQAYNPYKCELCKLAFESLGSLRLHTLNIHELKEYLDGLKDKGIKLRGIEDEGNLTLVQMRKKEQEKIQKEELKKIQEGQGLIPAPPLTTSSSGPLKSQEEKEKEKFSITCPTCNAGGLLFHEMHLTYDKMMRRSCKPCNRLFSRIEMLRRHNEASHGIPKEQHVDPPPCGRSEAPADLASSSGKWICCISCVLYFTVEEIHEIHVQAEKDPDRQICEICQKTFVSRYSFRTHLQREHQVPIDQRRRNNAAAISPGPGESNKRELTTEDLEKLTASTTVEQGITIFTCRVCMKNFKTGEFVHRHIKEVHAEDAFTRVFCKKCTATFKTVASLQKHMKFSHNPVSIRFVCYLCDKNFQRTDHVRAHFKTSHPTVQDFDMSKIKVIQRSQEDTEGLFVCKFCSNHYGNEAYLKRHMTTKHFPVHLSSYCEYCGLQLPPTTVTAHVKQYHSNQIQEESSPSSSQEKCRLSLMEIVDAMQSVYDMSQERKKKKARSRISLKKKTRSINNNVSKQSESEELQDSPQSSPRCQDQEQAEEEEEDYDEDEDDTSWMIIPELKLEPEDSPDENEEGLEETLFGIC